MRFLDNHVDIWNKELIIKSICKNFYNLIDDNYPRILGVRLETGSGTGKTRLIA